MTKHVTIIVTYPPSKNLLTKTTHNTKEVNINPINAIVHCVHQCHVLVRLFNQYENIPSVVKLKVINTLILYKTTSQLTLPPLNNKITRAATPKKIIP